MGTGGALCGPRLLLCALLTASPAFAWPVDRIIDLGPSKSEVLELTGVEWWDVEDPAVVSVTFAEGTGLTLAPRAAGRTHVLLYSQGRFAVYRVRVSSPARTDAALRGAAQAACGKFEWKPNDETRATLQVASEACRRALGPWLETDDVVASQLDITFELVALQAQLGAVEGALKAAKVKAEPLKYLGAGLVLAGRLRADEHRAALWAIFRSSVGRVALDDQVEVAPGPDAGSPGVDAGPVVPDAGVQRPSKGSRRQRP